MTIIGENPLQRTAQEVADRVHVYGGRIVRIDRIEGELVDSMTSVGMVHLTLIVGGQRAFFTLPPDKPLEVARGTV